MLDFLFGRGKSKDEARKRLTLVLAYERRGLPPNFVEKLRDDLVSVFSKYPQFEVRRIEVDIKREKEGFDELWISIPFKI
ncbi:cell division topological specificity factor MinE [Hydrogenobacter thermophilus TK-6]|uniref:Cell division topological specificity factor n=1 Tax=Hydrogenobacter thermophilus (strain DSM 6534 / IAM 12695 / TK-6) TaxID=608538 RepID=D3DI75_HYDTT|nr:cell division topological specificity factor MinE [Hydrogenobacter thermophilus]ADO45456.1 cell division topological specificity factor MinE [Hydrogenobacter thermophilus TK-6]BAI69527.1 cell division topological specificity factor [Hydrogenobacter thermophilus TK-6]